MRRERDRGQFSLFDSNSQQEKIMFNGILEAGNQREEYPSKQLLNFEKEMLGLYISGHPLLEYEEALSGLDGLSSLGEREDKASVTVGGIITGVKTIYTKKDQQMCFVDLEDIEGSLEVIVFPNIMEKYRELLAEDRIVMMKGKLDKKEDQLKLLANDIRQLQKDNRDTAGKTACNNITKEKIIFSINKKDLGREIINDFYDIIRKNPGKNMIEFRIITDNDANMVKKYDLPQDFRIDGNTSLLKDIETAFSGKMTWHRIGVKENINKNTAG